MYSAINLKGIVNFPNKKLIWIEREKSNKHISRNVHLKFLSYVASEVFMVILVWFFSIYSNQLCPDVDLIKQYKKCLDYKENFENMFNTIFVSPA